jgi:hypothetical protein
MLEILLTSAGVSLEGYVALQRILPYKTRNFYILEPTDVHFVKASSPFLKLSWTLLIWCSFILRIDI